jgi:hypothetical protein
MDDQQAGIALLDALRPDEAPATRDRLALLTPEGWSAVAALARQFRLAPLLFTRLRSHGGSEWSAGIEQQLRADFVLSLARATRFYQHLGAVLGGFHSAGIPVIVLKGAFLAEHVYESVAARPMGDADVLVHAEDLGRAADVLGPLGFRPLSENHPVNEFTHHHHYIHVDHGLPVEVHWALCNPRDHFAIDLPGLWARAVPGTCAGQPVLALAPEDLLLHFCVHNAVHGFGIGPRAIVDVAQVIHRHPAGSPSAVDWRTVVERAHAWRAGKAAYLTFAFAREYLAADVPGAVLEALEPAASDASMVETARQQVLGGGSNAPAGAPEFNLLWGGGRWRDKLGVLRVAFFPSRDLMATLYPPDAGSPAILFYYPVRWARLLRVYGRRAFAILRGDRASVATAKQHATMLALGEWLRG